MKLRMTKQILSQASSLGATFSNCPLTTQLIKTMAEEQDETDQDEKDSAYKPQHSKTRSSSPTDQRMRHEQAGANIKHGNSVANNESHVNQDEAEFNGKEEDEEEDTEDEDDEDDEPHMKYMRVTARLSAVYRNADATSAVTISGDKMVCFRARHYNCWAL